MHEERMTGQTPSSDSIGKPWHLDWQVPKFPKAEGDRRHKLIREQMGYREFDCLIIAGNSANFRGYELDTRYVSGFASWFDPNYIVFPMEGEPIIFTFSIAHAMLAESIGFIEARPFVREGFRFNHVASIVGRLKELGLEKAKIGIISMRIISGLVYAGLLDQLPNAKFLDAGDLVRQIRICKSQLELDFMRKSAECADKGWEAMRDAARPGEREFAIAAACDYAMQLRGAESGPHVLLSSGNGKFKSADNTLSGGARVLQKGDIIVNEITPSYGGYYTQLCRPISLGPPDDDFKRLAEIHLAMYEIGRNELKAGVLLEDIEAKIKEVGMKLGKGRFDPNGIWALQSCEIADTSLYKMRGELKPGMCFVVHPKTTDAKIREGSPDYICTHTIGDSFIIKEDGNECLSKLPNEITVK